MAYSSGWYLNFPLEALAELYDFSLLYDDASDTLIINTDKPSYMSVVKAKRDAHNSLAGMPKAV